MNIEINPGFNETVLLADGRMLNADFRRYRAKWESNPKWDVVEWEPIHLDLETTARCQLKCLGCPSTKLKFDKGDMDFDMAKHAIREFASLGGSSIKMNWRGEPTLYPHLAELVAYANECGLVDIAINTNGVALTPKLSKELIDAGITMVAFSIDSVDPQRYAKLRPGAELVRVLLNLRAFLNEAERKPIYVRVQRIEYPDETMTHDDFAKYFETDFPRVNAVASNFYKAKELEGDTSRPSNPCAQLWQRLIMTYDGWLGPCCEFNRFGEHRFGKFPDTSITRLWTESIELDGLRRYHRSGDQNKIEACARCTVTKPMVRT